MASTYLSRTPSSTGNRRKFTFSAWVKFNFNQLANNSRIFSCGNATSSWVSAYFNSTGDLQLAIVEGGNTYTIQTNRLFRDESAWYHLVFVVDTENATANYRLRIYVNGEEETSFSQRNNPTQNLDTQANTSSKPIDIGSAENVGYSPRYFPGIMSHVHMTDGYVYSASNFGSTDATTGEWKINTSPSVTYGTNGFFILKDGNSVTDQSGNSNNFSVGGGTLTKTEDCPSNNFATFNPVVATNSTMALTNGNTKAQTGSNYANNSSNSWFSSLGISSGKYYAEFKPKTATRNVIGIGFDLSTAQKGSGANQYNFAYTSYGFAYKSGAVGNDSVGYTSSGYDTYTADDIIGIAVDLDNNKLYVSKNGTFQNSADPSNGTGGYSITADKEYFFAVSDNAGTDVCYTEANFGNGYFGTTAVSSAGTNASGNGIFEYDVPTGFTALSTKGLNL